MDLDIAKLFKLPGDSTQIYGWKTLKSDNINYEKGDVGLVDFIGINEDPSEDFLQNPFLVQSVWGSTCPIYDAKFCPDLGKIKLIYLGGLDFTDDYLIYYEIWVKLKKEAENPRKKRKTLPPLKNTLNFTRGAQLPPSFQTPGFGGMFSKLQPQSAPIPPTEYNLLSSRNLNYYHDLWQSEEGKGIFKLGKVAFYPIWDCPYVTFFSGC